MADIVVLTARFGHGHLSAAENILAALGGSHPGLSAVLLDPFLVTNPRLYRFLQWLYRFAAHKLPWTWSLFFRLADRHDAGERRLFRSRPFRAFFESFYDSYRPKVVVTTYPVFATAVRHFYGGPGECPFQLVTVVTDSVAINRAWLRGPADRYFVPDSLTARSIENKGVPPGAIRVTGFPVPPRFADVLPRPELARDGLRGSPMTILYLPNLGTQNLFRILKILGVSPNLKVILGLGDRPRLARRVRRLAPRLKCEIEILGWVPGICDRMFEADMVITKAGGATVHEALAAGCPVVISQVTPGQEEGNAHLIESLGLGMVVRDVRGLSRLLMFFHQVDFSALSEMRRNVGRFRRPDASVRIAEELDAMAATAQGPPGPGRRGGGL